MTALTTTPENHSKPIGPIVRWVSTAFLVFGVVLFWLLDKIGNAVWQIFAEPNTAVVSAGAAIASAVTTLVLYRNERINRITHDVLGELMKVTWPTRQETQVSTIVVIVASIIASVVVGVLDAAWSQLTDLIY
jgi:preprotein translocase SecE subunit